MQRSCAIIHIHLNGPKHTIKCVQIKTGRPGILPDTPFRTACILGGVLEELDIWNYDWSGELCFNGDSGYIGVQIYDVNDVSNYALDDTWIRYYNSSGGHYCTLPGVQLPLQHNDIGFGDPSSVKVTQIDMSADNGPHC